MILSVALIGLTLMLALAVVAWIVIDRASTPD